MKSFLFSLFILLTCSTELHCQWYEKKYHVQDIHLLSQEQLQELLKASKTGAVTSAGVACMGGLGLIIIPHAKSDSDEEKTLPEEIIGEKGMKNIGMVICGAFLAGGAISCISLTGRSIKIKSILNSEASAGVAISISPEIRYCRVYHQFYPAMTLGLRLN